MIAGRGLNPRSIERWIAATASLPVDAMPEQQLQAFREALDAANLSARTGTPSDTHSRTERRTN
jgi:hypothetical protein